MSQYDRDQAELKASKRALAEAKTATAELEVALTNFHRTNQSIRSAVAPNGYVERFRAIMRGT